MIALLVSSKSMDFESPLPGNLPEVSSPEFQKEAAQLNQELAELDEDSLQEVMKISPALARQTRERLRQFSPRASRNQLRPACLAFCGDVYEGLGARAWGKRDLLYSQKHMRILSGLYGILRPMDAIQPYRLEPGYRWSPEEQSPSLTAFWKAKVTTHLQKALAAVPPGERILVDLASKEFSAMIDFSQLEVPIITPQFQEVKGGQRKTVPLYTKRARGAMARYLVLNRLRTPEDLKAFAGDGYAFDPAISDEQNWYFIR